MRNIQIRGSGQKCINIRDIYSPGRSGIWAICRDFLALYPFQEPSIFNVTTFGGGSQRDSSPDGATFVEYFRQLLAHNLADYCDFCNVHKCK